MGETKNNNYAFEYHNLWVNPFHCLGIGLFLFFKPLQAVYLIVKLVMLWSDTSYVGQNDFFVVYIFYFSLLKHYISSPSLESCSKINTQTIIDVTNIENNTFIFSFPNRCFVRGKSGMRKKLFKSVKPTVITYAYHNYFYIIPRVIAIVIMNEWNITNLLA